MTTWVITEDHAILNLDRYDQIVVVEPEKDPATGVVDLSQRCQVVARNLMPGMSGPTWIGAVIASGITKTSALAIAGVIGTGLKAGRNLIDLQAVASAAKAEMGVLNGGPVPAPADPAEVLDDGPEGGGL